MFSILLVIYCHNNAANNHQTSVKYTVSPLHTNLQVTNCQRCAHASGSSKEPEQVPSMSGMSETVACPPSPVAEILQLYHLQPPLPPLVSNPSCLFTLCQPLYASCCTVLLYFSRYCTVRLKMFSLFLCLLGFMYYLYEKYYKPITVQYYIADCVSWVARLTLLDL